MKLAANIRHVSGHCRGFRGHYVNAVIADAYISKASRLTCLKYVYFLDYVPLVPSTVYQSLVVALVLPRLDYGGWRADLPA